MEGVFRLPSTPPVQPQKRPDGRGRQPAAAVMCAAVRLSRTGFGSRVRYGAARSGEIRSPGRLRGQLQGVPLRFFRVGGVSPIWGVGPRCDGGSFSADWFPLASAGTVTAAVLRWITLWSCRHGAIDPTPKVPGWAVATPRDWTGGPVQSSDETRVERAGEGSLQVRRRDESSKKAGPADRSSSIRGLALTTSRRCRPARRARKGLHPPRRPAGVPARRVPCAGARRPAPLPALPGVRPLCR